MRNSEKIAFHEWLETQGYSLNTQNAYVAVIKSYLLYLKKHRIYRLQEVSELLLNSFVKKGINKHYAPATIASRLAALGLFYSWAYKNKMCYDNPILRFFKKKVDNKLYSKVAPKNKHPTESLKCGKKTMEILTPNEELKLLSTTASKKTLPLDSRNRLIIHLLLTYALQTEEIIKIKLSDINLNEMLLTFGTEHRVFKITSKIKKMIENWLSMRNTSGRNNNEYLFPNNSGGHLCPRALRHVVNEYLHAAEINKSSMGPKILRCTSICNFIKNGTSLKKLSELLGFKNVSSLQKYLSVLAIQ
jgi:Site-specific recombinase XerD